MTRFLSWSRRAQWLAVPAAIISLLISGCGSGSESSGKLVSAAGKVTLDGKPTEGIRLFFQPIGGKAGSFSSAITDAEGKFKVIHSSKKEGCPPGKYEVLISRKVKSDGTLLGSDESPTMVRAIETISKIYSDPSKAGKHNRIEVPDGGVEDLDFRVASTHPEKKK